MAGRLASVTTRIDVDLSERRLRLYVSGHVQLTTRAGIGAPGTPTPVGRFYINQILIPSEPDGPFGPAAFGVSAFSPTLAGWPQGGPIAIHGTNDPSSIARRGEPRLHPHLRRGGGRAASTRAGRDSVVIHR